MVEKNIHHAKLRRKQNMKRLGSENGKIFENTRRQNPKSTNNFADEKKKKARVDLR